MFPYFWKACQGSSLPRKLHINPEKVATYSTSVTILQLRGVGSGKEQQSKRLRIAWIIQQNAGIDSLTLPTCKLQT